ncbi:MAG: prephenate dehydrogenase/arogenate dehydrogenase family protein [Gammaproteobacteria bacterium]|nr:prephenate dehydrogenase/arogenate dehydrogenase family protein [Gammaproteobacteria bacterium]MDH5693230.1 prephenate dehydrogenase/arogenate dehydrogenase family protein [Gammaproteobacteria bacterium]
MSFLFERVTIIGVGLIGGSLARALKKAGVAGEIVGVGRNGDELKLAVELGVIDSFNQDAALACANADCVVLATPLGVMKEVLQQIKNSVSETAVLTDVGSAKRSVINDVLDVFGVAPPGFVPAHPIAGTEKSGVSASFDTLFKNRCSIITPTEHSAPWAVEKTKKMWETTGARTVIMDAQHHDEVLAATSHLPHLLAYLLVDTLAKMQEHQEIFEFAAGGFRDFTRIASSDPKMWRDICVANRDGILNVLAKFEKELADARYLLENMDGEGLTRVFKRAQEARQTHIIG